MQKNPRKQMGALILKKSMLPSGFEPEYSARKAEMIGRTTLWEHMSWYWTAGKERIVFLRFGFLYSINNEIQRNRPSETYCFLRDDDSANIVKLRISNLFRNLTAPRLRGNVPAKTDVCAHTSGAGKSDEPAGNRRFARAQVCRKVHRREPRARRGHRDSHH